MVYNVDKDWLMNNGLISNGKTPPYNPKLIDRAKQLRKEMTKSECKLWFQFLKDHTFRFQRQKVIDHYIVDFYCSKAKLIIEIDGSYHYDNDQFQYDQIRSDRLNIYNLSIIRFDNNEILNDFNNVCISINNILIPPS